jgi:hypothetical protein
VSTPNDKTKYIVEVVGRKYSFSDAFNRLNKLVSGAVQATYNDHKTDKPYNSIVQSITKRVVKQLMGNGYGLELLASIVQSGTTGPDVSVEILETSVAPSVHTCPACQRLTRDTTAGCDHCDLEDK